MQSRTLKCTCDASCILLPLKGRVKFKLPLRGDNQTLAEFLDRRFFGQSPAAVQIACIFGDKSPAIKEGTPRIVCATFVVAGSITRVVLSDGRAPDTWFRIE